MKPSDILILIPAYNEEENLRVLLKDIKLNYPKIDVLVIDDASQDKTKDIVKKSGINIISHSFNLGIGAAVETGLKYALGNNYDYVIRLDGDGQHPVKEIEKLLSVIKKENPDVVIGTRYLNFSENKYKGNKLRKIATYILSKFVSLVTRQNFTDVTSGFIALNKKSIKFLLERYPEDYPEVESIILLCKNSFKIKEVSVDMNLRQAGVSSIGFFTSLYYMLRVLLAVFIFSIGRKK